MRNDGILNEKKRPRRNVKQRAKLTVKKEGKEKYVRVGEKCSSGMDERRWTWTDYRQRMCIVMTWVGVRSVRRGLLLKVNIYYENEQKLDDSRFI